MQELPDERLDQLDLLRVGGVGLDQQVVDLGGDGVRVLVDQRREDPRLADRRRGPRAAARSRRSGPSRSPRRPVRPRRPPASPRAAPRPPSRRWLRARWAAVRVTITSSRSPGTMTSDPGPIRASMWAGSIAPMATPSITRSRSRPGQITRPRTPSSTIPSVGFDRIGRYGSTPSSGIPWRARPRRASPRSPAARRPRTLFTIAPGDRHAVRAEVGRVEHDLVDRPPDPALGHDHRRRAEHLRDHRVRQPDHRPDPGVPGPLDDQHVVARRTSRAPRGSGHRGPRRPAPRCTPW